MLIFLSAHGEANMTVMKLVCKKCDEAQQFHLQFRADFYFKVDDDVIVNVPALVAYLEPRRQHGNLYMARAAAQMPA